MRIYFGFFNNLKQIPPITYKNFLSPVKMTGSSLEGRGRSGVATTYHQNQTIREDRPAPSPLYQIVQVIPTRGRDLVVIAPILLGMIIRFKL